VVEAVQQDQPLVEKLLRLGALRRDRVMVVSEILQDLGRRERLSVVVLRRQGDGGEKEQTTGHSEGPHTGFPLHFRRVSTCP
jgi:hypothetical protein